MPQRLTTAPVDPESERLSGYIETLREIGAQEKTTMTYTHILNKGPMGGVSPVDTR